ncbi:acetyl-CoA carboxylase carboxyltransferase subunit alpha [bacterium]|nr:acetyl-CoA carboxylase carboxyltransferase subunit alpha [FCB group bacterium]MBL7190776.1 acetyl-CoA carboxylase carboxyltransferase subunit alpha [bacterium]
MNRYILDFEKPVYELEQKINELIILEHRDGLEVSEEVERLKSKVEKLKKSIFSKLGSWEKLQVARHPHRPYTLDYISRITKKFIELHGDRRFADDPAIVAGIGEIESQPIVIVGHQKGRSTKENIRRNFGMPNPEGYRKALRIMELGAKFNRPILTLIDTPGAYPGIGAEERGQAEAIAHNLFVMSTIPVPIIAFVTGEGGSGGALALGLADKVMMLEHSIYSVISPEGCASILFNDSKKNKQAAEAMKITAQDLIKLKIVDEIIPEPLGGAHNDYDLAAVLLKQAVLKSLDELRGVDSGTLIENRREKYRKMGFWKEK